MAGNRTSVIDAENRTTSYAYDGLNRVVTTTNPLGGQTIVRYDAVGNREQLIDANENVTEFEYDSLYRLIETTDAENQTTVISYDALGNRLTTTDAENNTTSFAYDSLNRLTVTTLNYEQGGPSNFETNVTTVVTYDALSRRTSVTDGRDNSTQFGYDALGRTTVITDALGNATRFSYDGRGNRRSVTNAEDETTDFEYDGVDRLVRVTDPLLNQTDYGYNKAGERTGMIDAETVETRYNYDDLGRLTIVTENYVNGGPSNEETNLVTRYGYDKVGNRTVITDARSYTTTYVYDGLNRRSRMIDALGNQTRYGYDGVGNRTVITDANGIITSFGYDDVNRLTGIDYGDATPDVSVTYDQVGNRTTMTDGVGQTIYGYDALYRLEQVTQPAASGGAALVVGYGYDEVGNRTSLTYPDTRSVSYSYDEANRLDTVTADWINGQFGYNYDDANRLDSLSLPNDVSSNYDYDEAGRLTLLAHSTLTDTLASYAYSLDDVGNRRVLTESLVTVESLAVGTYLEEAGLVVMEAESGDRTNGTSHNWLLQTSTSGYTGTSYLYPSLDNDSLYQTTEITSASPSAAYAVNFTTPGTYTVWLRGYPSNSAGDSVYVGLGEELVEVTGFAPQQWDWANLSLSGSSSTLPVGGSGVYTLNLWMREDGLRIDRLLLTTDTLFVPTGFGPAETDRLTSQATTTTTLTRTIVYTYDNLYRLTNADYTTGENYAYTYDEVGNRLQQIIDGDTTTYLYDEANRLEQLNGQSVYTFDDNGNLLNSDTLTNTFDAANRLTSSTRDGTTVEPVYNGVNDRVGQTVGISTTDFALDVVGLPEVIYTSEGNVYLHLPGVIVAESAGGEMRYLLSDGLGSVRQATDEDGAVVAYNEFDPYGNPVQTGSEPYGFTGEWWQDDVGLLHLRARWYSVETGTFLSRDPVESEPPYAYVRGNPVSRIDPSGQFSEQAIKTSVSPEVLSILRSSRIGLYKLLQDAEDREVIDPLWITIDPFDNDYTPAHPIPHASARLDCISGRNIEAEVLSVDRYSSGIRMSLDEYIRYLDWVERTDITSAYKRGGNESFLKSRYAKTTFTHYYSLSRLTNKAHYYSDFFQDSPLPDIVAREVSIGLNFSFGPGRTTLIDKFGNGYISWGFGIGWTPGGIVKRMEGYVNPPSRANTPAGLQNIILGYGYSYETDYAGVGGGRSLPVPETGSITWYSKGSAIAAYGITMSDTSGPYDWGIQGWDFLDPPASDAVAFLPDNGCNCGS